MRIRITSVGYDDFLDLTLPHWLRIAPPESVVVVTSVEDLDTQRVAALHGAAVFITDAWTRRDPTYHHDTSHWSGLRRERGQDIARPVLNKALALDESFGFVGHRVSRPKRYDICLAIDADCKPEGELPDEDSIAARTIYGCERYQAKADGSRGELIALRGRITKSQHRQVTCVGGGYFQMFRYEPGMRFGSYPAADGYDYDFAMRMPVGHRLTCISVVHFGETHRNWEGRKTPRYAPQVSQ